MEKKLKSIGKKIIMGRKIWKSVLKNNDSNWKNNEKIIIIGEKIIMGR